MLTTKHAQFHNPQILPVTPFDFARDERGRGGEREVAREDDEALYDAWARWELTLRQAQPERGGDGPGGQG